MAVCFRQLQSDVRLKVSIRSPQSCRGGRTIGRFRTILLAQDDYDFVSVSISDFWRLLAESRLLTAPQVQQLAGEFAGSQPPTEQANSKAAAQWLLTRKVLSRYQAMVLLKGRAGPFFYGDYKVYDRIEQGRLAGQFRAIH